MLTSAVGFGLALLSYSAFAAPPEPSWFNHFPALDGDVAAIATKGDTIYVGGYFTTAGGQIVNRVARWDGRRWSSLGSGMDQPVLALALDDRGHLYAGGVFTRAGDATARHVAKWDGDRWRPLGAGTDATVHALAVGADGTVYAGGAFTQAGDADAAFIARWSEGRWAALAGGMDHHVFALQPSPDGRLFAGGGFTTAGGEPIAQIALWDGTRWESVGGGLHPAMKARPVLALALSPEGHLYAGGSFARAGTESVPFLAQWDGRRWSALGSGVNGSVHALAVAADGTLYAGGFFLGAGGLRTNHIAAWTNPRWLLLEDGTNAAVHALAIGEDGVVHVGGSFSAVGIVQARSLACWGAGTAVGSEEYHPRREDGFYIMGTYPNPAGRRALVSLTAPGTATITLRVFDLLGRLAFTRTETGVPAGRFDLEVDASLLPNGVYTAFVTVGEQHRSTTFVVQH